MSNIAVLSVVLRNLHPPLNHLHLFAKILSQDAAVYMSTTEKCTESIKVFIWPVGFFAVLNSF